MGRWWVAVCGVLGLLAGTGCASAPAGQGGEGPITEQQGKATGEVVDGIPTYEERTVLHMTNRIRAGMDCGNASLVCGGAPLRPVQWEHNLGKAAHWFARHLHDAGCFQHQTCCYLQDVGGVVGCDSQGVTCPGGSCDYTPDCPGTDTFSRISMFGGSAVSENIAAGNATAEATICQWYFSSGHHDNICTASRGSLGTGHYGGSNCYGSYWVQNFGSNALSAGLASGSHWGSTSAPTFGAAFYDPSPTGPPERAAVVIDGLCHNLALEYGNNTSATYAADLTVTSGCHAYYFLFTSSGGTRYTYPTIGSYLLGSGCGVYTANQAGADCEGGTGNCVSGETRACYTGTAATREVGACQDGTETCVGGTWGACQGEVLPSTEACDNVDNDCNGTVDDPCDCTPGATRPCGTDVGECVAGTETCASLGTWGTCQGSTLPGTELCDGLDNDCDGVVDNGCPGVDGGQPPADGEVPADGEAPPTDSAVGPDGGPVPPYRPLVTGGCHCGQGVGPGSFGPGDGGPLGGVPLVPLMLLGLAVGWARRRRAAREGAGEARTVE